MQVEISDWSGAGGLWFAYVDVLRESISVGMSMRVACTVRDTMHNHDHDQECLSRSTMHRKYAYSRAAKLPSQIVTGNRNSGNNLFFSVPDNPG